MNLILSALTLLMFNADIPAKVSYLVGTVTIDRAGKKYSAVLNASLLVDDVITTGAESECEVQFSNYALVRLQPNSSIKIERKEETPKGIFHSVFASMGDIVSKVTKMNKNDEYQVRTEAAQAFIRGTIFKTTVEQDGTSSFSVFEGNIAVKSLLEGAKEILLNENFKSQIKKGELEPFVDKLSELEITAFASNYKDFLDRGKALDQMREKLDEEKKKLEKDIDEKKDDAKDKLKGLFK
jgi:hypothetical protein